MLQGLDVESQKVGLHFMNTYLQNQSHDKQPQKINNNNRRKNERIRGQLCVHRKTDIF